MSIGMVIGRCSAITKKCYLILKLMYFSIYMYILVYIGFVSKYLGSLIFQNSAFVLQMIYHTLVFRTCWAHWKGIEKRVYKRRWEELSYSVFNFQRPSYGHEIPNCRSSSSASKNVAWEQQNPQIRSKTTASLKASWRYAVYRNAGVLKCPAVRCHLSLCALM